MKLQQFLTKIFIFRWPPCTVTPFVWCALWYAKNAHINTVHFSSGSSEAQELHIEYWATPSALSQPNNAESQTSSTGGLGMSSSSTPPVTTPGKKDSLASQGVKYSMKTAFRALAVCRSHPDAVPPSLSLQFVKEKKKDKSKLLLFSWFCCMVGLICQVRVHADTNELFDFTIEFLELMKHDSYQRSFVGFSCYI